jgi:hypothetical protein
VATPMPDCPTCGHNLTAYVGTACSGFVINDEGWPRSCGPDCAREVYGENPMDVLKRLLSPSVSSQEEKEGETE